MEAVGYFSNSGKRFTCPSQQYGSSSGSGQKWLDSGCILKVEPKLFPNRLDEGESETEETRMTTGT